MKNDLIAQLENFVAWAVSMGFDPTVNYVNPPDPSEPGEPPVTVPEPLPPGYLSPNFKASEFACRHCGDLGPGIDQDLIDALQAMRDHTGQPITINSGYRCPTHNANVGGATNSQHLLGTAADFTIRGMTPAQVYALLDPVWPGGLGRYNTFTHIDTRGSRARWSG